MLEYLELIYVAQDREGTGMESGRQMCIDIKNDEIKWRHSHYSYGIMPEPVFNNSSDSKEGVFKGDIESFIAKLEATGFRNWNHEFAEEMVDEGEYYNLKYRDHGQKMICLSNIDDIDKVEEMESLLLSLKSEE